jgi:hypothetical protein
MRVCVGCDEFAGWARSMFMNQVLRPERRQGMRKLPVTGNTTMDDRAHAPQQAWMMRRMPSFSILAVAEFLAVAR